MDHQTNSLTPARLLFILLLALTTMAFPADAPSFHRYALLVGVNDGGPGKVRLHYAVSDAESMSRLLETLGGVSAADRVLLADPDRTAIEGAFEQLGERIKKENAPDARTEVVFYYSGHSDEEGLCLGDKKMAYVDLRSRIRALPSSVKVAILDSCSSGTITRLKGGKQAAPFLVDTSARMEGHAFLTSSSGDEAAQESDRIGGSFFTHYLVTGLRGAADGNRDGRVTLNEGYDFAFRETLANTERSQAGPQHAGYDIQLSGTGDLVLTDTRNPASTLTLPAEIAGRVTLRNDKGQLALEMRKTAGEPLPLALESGTYQVAVTEGGKTRVTSVSLTHGQRSTLDPATLAVAPVEPTVRRGKEPATTGIPLVAGSMASLASLSNLVSLTNLASLGSLPGLMGGKAMTFVAPVTDDGMNLDPISLAFTPGLQLPLRRSGRTKTLVGIHVLGGLTEEVDGYYGGSVFSIVTGRARGLVCAGAYAQVGGGSGMVASGAVNTVNGDFEGVAAAGAVGIHTGAVKGLAANGGVTLGTTLDGCAAAGGVIVLTGNARGLVASGGVNVIGSNADGCVATGGGNVIGGSANGLVAAGGFNLVGRDMKGLLSAGGFNVVGGTLTGMEAAVVNIAKTMVGPQFGVVNIAGDIRGAQFGVINIARHMDGIGIGLINIIGNGMQSPELTWDDQGMLNMSFKLGSPHFYTFIGLDLGWNRNDPMERWAVNRAIPEFGFGFHLTANRFFVDLVTTGGEVLPNLNPMDWVGSRNLLLREEVLFGFSFAKHLSIVGGLTYNLLADFGDVTQATRSMGASVKELALPSPHPLVRHWLGFKLGVRF